MMACVEVEQALPSFYIAARKNVNKIRPKAIPNTGTTLSFFLKVKHNVQRPLLNPSNIFIVPNTFVNSL